MKIAVIGAGAIGSLVAGYLKKNGIDVLLVGRPDHVGAIKKDGLRISGVRGEDVIRITAKTKLDGHYDLVIFAVKTQDLERAYQDNHEYLENNPWVLTTQNGVQADNMISTHFDKARVISSIVMFGATYIQPGAVTFNFEGNWIIGRPFVVNDPQVREIADILERAFKVVVTQDIVGMKWLKLFVNFNNCIPALIGRSMQETFADMDFCRLSVRLLKEGFEITQKADIELVSLPDFPVERIKRLAGMPEDQAAGILNQTLTKLSDKPLYGSILQSVMRKKPSEIDFINGEVVAMAKSMGIKADLNRRVVDMVHEVEQKGKFMDADAVKSAFALN